MQTGPRENGLTESFVNNDKLDAITLTTHSNGTSSDSSDRPIKHSPLHEQQDSDIHNEAQNNGPPSKRRKLADTATRHSSTPRPVSPPWKKVAVDGPTSFIEGGRRKSSRTNFVPLELQPQADKRQTRATLQHTQGVKGKHAGIATLKSSPLTQSPAHSLINGKRPLSSGRSTSAIASRSPSKATPSNGEFTKQHAGPVTPVKRSHKKKVPAVPADGSLIPQHRRAARASNPSTSDSRSEPMAPNGWHHSEEEGDGAEESADGEDGHHVQDASLLSPFKRPRLNLKVRMPTVITSHPEHIPARRRHASFEDWFQKDESMAGDGIARLTDEDAKTEAGLINQILDASQPEGLLSQERCSRYLPDRQEEPPQQYAHQDYMVAAVIDFQRRLARERTEHRKHAKRTAELALAQWIRRGGKLEPTEEEQPQKSAEEIEQDAHDAFEAHYKYNVCQSLKIMWGKATTEIRNRRRERWRAEQQRLGREKLNKVLEKSTRMLHKRSTGIISSETSENDSDMDSDISTEEWESSPIEGEDDDEFLTPEQLHRKYDHVPELEGGSRHQSPADYHDENRIVAEASVDVEPVDVEPVDVEPVNVEPGRPDSDQADDQKSDDVEVSGAVPPQPENDSDAVDNGVAQQVEDALMDDSDASTNMDDDMGESEDGFADDVSGGSDGEESEASDRQETGLLGFFPKGALTAKDNLGDEIDLDHRNAQLDRDKKDQVETQVNDRNAEVLYIPDATQVQTPSASNSEDAILDHAKISDCGTSQIHKASVRADFPSADRAGAASPRKDTTHHLLTDLKISSDHTEDHQMSLPTTPVSTSMVRTPVPSLLRGTLREYQHVGLDWLAKLYADQTNGILADEMGLGKTIQTIALLAHLAIEHEAWGPHLIVVPTSVMLNWEIEFKKFLPGFKVLTYYGTIEERKRKREGWMNDDKWNVWITSYALVVQDNQIFRRRDWHYMVLDEAHNIKNFRSQRWQTLLNFKSRARLLLTGTPLQNNLTELWSLLFFLMPTEGPKQSIGGFADLQQFTDWFRQPVEQILEHGEETMDEEGRATVKRLHHTLRPYILRRLKADVEKQMPGKYEHIVYCKLSKRQRELYQGFLNRAETKAIYASGNHLSMMNCIMQLRKVCCHPDLFETRQIVTSFAMPKSAVADFEIKDLLIRRRLLQQDQRETVNLDFINLMPGANEPLSALDTIQKQRLGAIGMFRQLFAQQWTRLIQDMHFDGRTVKSTLAHLENVTKRARFETLRHASYHTMLRSQRRPLYSHRLLSRLRLGLESYPLPPHPQRQAGLAEHSLNTSTVLEDMIMSLTKRSDSLHTIIQKFACITPKAIATDILSYATPQQVINNLRPSPQSCPTDAFHEARMRLSIAFPDKRLLQYDCGKLQSLDALLRKLQAGGHRALVFTQMTKVLDVLEQFLNIHGHRYLRLDGGTKIEQRQILTERFNSDERITVFILSTRSGGLGINLTGADSVIFYDSDWNPAMDKQCQDRSHRIGQTRDVHIYRLVSESTVEVNIMRRARQKTRLDEVVIQEGQFNTDHFQGATTPDIARDTPDDGDMETNAALDRVLGGRSIAKVFDQVEDKEDVAAARIAEKEMLQTDAADFDEAANPSSAMTPKTPGPQTPGEVMPPPSAGADTVERTQTLDAATSGLATPGADLGSAGIDDEAGHIDDYMLRLLEWEYKDIPLQPDPEFVKRQKKKADEHRVKRRAK